MTDHAQDLGAFVLLSTRTLFASAGDESPFILPSETNPLSGTTPKTPPVEPQAQDQDRKKQD